jgi:hypothetical protein
MGGKLGMLLARAGHEKSDGPQVAYRFEGFRKRAS